MSTPALELNPAGSPVLEAMEPSTPPSAQEADPNSAGSPALSPDSSSHDATLSVPACSPADSDNLSPDELELLAKLEEQNRLLEADSKSMRSMSGSRRNSGSSLVSSSSASSNLSHLEEDTWILWGRIVNEWEEWRRKKDKLLKELIRKGIPHHFRAIVWQLLGNAADMPVKNQYSELLKMSSPCEKLIRRDIARTYPEHDFFKGQDSLGQEVLFNVMKAYSLVDREVGYCQGSAFIVGLLLMQMPEEEAFCVFVRLMQEYRLRELFKPSMAELGLCIYQFEYMLQEQLPELNVHFRSQSFHTSMYASSWFLTLFLTFYPLPVATRIFDIFMYEGLEIIFRVGMAILQYNQTDLIQLDMEGMSQHFQKVIPHQFESCPDKLILRAYQIKYNPKKMKRLEKEYTTIKNKEMEEQIEIKRLRTENRLLKQRIETLEKGQVTRALEAEENYVIKRELAVVRQQCTAASQSLEKAQDTIRELQEHKGDPRYTAEFASDLQTQLEQSRLQEAELLGALREMQDKVLHMEKRNSLLPDENNMAQLQDELKAVKQREMQTLNSFKEMQSQISDLNEHWQLHMSRSSGGGGHWKESPKKNALNDLQDKLMTARLREAQAQAETRELRLQAMQLESQNQINSNLLNRQEVESAALQEKLQYLGAQNKGLQTQLSEMKRKQAESDCKSKEEVMAVRLREADSMAAVAELRQRIADLEIQKEEGRIQGQLNNSDSSQYIRELKDQIAELKTEIRLQKGHQQRFKDPMTAFDGIHIVNHVMRDGDSLSSDEDLLPSPLAVGGLQDALYPLNPGSACFLRGVENPGKDSDGSTDSEQEERTSAAQLYAHMVCGDNVNNLEN
ncbi:EVI5-like protein isoform X2 [Acipenser ruthenus]|uniref:EVI5-like protein isoform X2 n=1 Tax=Acipenser ruthenus TaxID=7906 RepID=UPI00274210A3|nr:EVI5-like protein isoform X2 [Acipenser ruthenus]